MSRWAPTAVGAALVKRAGTIDPSKHPDETFDLYSVPAYERGVPDVLQGSSIGSSKQIVQPGDVLLCRIVPHIRRAWIVGPGRGRRIIASGEWMVFRSKDFDPAWLRHVLLADRFHKQMMQTVAGVGGSLMRARPSHVATIEVPVPPLDEQRRIAAILDQAEALRAKRHKLIANFDEVVLSTFRDTFGANDWPRAPLASLAEIADCPHSTPRWTERGEVCIRTSNLTRGGWDWSDTRYVSAEEYALRSRRSEAKPGDIILSREGTVGVAAIVEQDMRLCMGQRLVQVRVDRQRLDAGFVLHFLLHALAPQRISHVMVGSTARHLNVRELRQLPTPVPPLELQLKFSTELRVVALMRTKAVGALEETDSLYRSLQSRAFRGEL